MAFDESRLSRLRQELAADPTVESEYVWFDHEGLPYGVIVHREGGRVWSETWRYPEKTHIKPLPPDGSIDEQF